ncbi:MAG: hypothetical protein J5706_04760, partial [Elusimicrobiales bacterium]|nr:hypothetical protein [Elusimicrobiales bacterium]
MKKFLIFAILSAMAMPFCISPAAAQSTSVSNGQASKASWFSSGIQKNISDIEIEGLEIGWHLGGIFPSSDFKNDDFEKFGTGFNAGIRFYPFVIGAEWQTLGYIETGDDIVARFYEYGPYAKIMFNPEKHTNMPANNMEAELYAKIGGGAFKTTQKHFSENTGNAFNIGIGFDLRPKTSKFVIGIEYRYHRVKPDGAKKYMSFGHSLNLNYTFRFGAKKINITNDYASSSYT